MLYSWIYILDLELNIVQFNIDQLAERTFSREIKCYLSYTGIVLIYQLYSLYLNFNDLLLIFFILSFMTLGVTVSVVLITRSFFKHWLKTTPLISNPFTDHQSIPLWSVIKWLIIIGINLKAASIQSKIHELKIVYSSIWF